MTDSESPTRGYRGVVPMAAHRVGFSLRLRPQVRQAVEDRARANGRSLSQEGETMLELQLQLDQVFGERASPAFNLAIAFATAGARGAVEYLLKTCSPAELRQYILSAETRAAEPQA